MIKDHHCTKTRTLCGYSVGDYNCLKRARKAGTYPHMQWRFCKVHSSHGRRCSRRGVN